MWIERPSKIFLTSVEGDHVHLGLAINLPFSFTWYSCCITSKQIFRNALHLKIFSQCPTAFISSWKKSNVEMRTILNTSRFLLGKNQIREINICFLPPHCLVLLSIDALSPQKGTYIVHFVSQVSKKCTFPIIIFLTLPSVSIASGVQ